MFRYLTMALFILAGCAGKRAAEKPLERSETRLPARAKVPDLHPPQPVETQSQVQRVELQNVNRMGLVSFRNHSDLYEIRGNEWREFGIKAIQAAPVSDYCTSAQPVILPPGSRNAPFSYLSTANPGSTGMCNAVPVAIYFTRPMAEVIIRFFGAASRYELIAYTNQGQEIGSSTQSASPYNYETPAAVRIFSAMENIDHVTFGREKCLTQIAEIEFK